MANAMSEGREGGSADGDGAGSQEDVDALLDQADAMRHGASQVAIGEQAVRLADLAGDDELGFRARKKLIQYTIFSGFPEKTLIAFAWCLGRCDAQPERFHLKEWLWSGPDLLWIYKWIIENAPHFPQISRAQLDQTIGDMQARYIEHGLSLRPVHLQRTRLAMTVADSVDDARACFQAFEAAPRDEYADCEACERNFEVEVLLYTGEIERAIQRAQPLLRNELACGEVPHITLAVLTRPLFERGRRAEAAACRRAGFRICAGQTNFLREVALLLDYESATGGRQAVAMLERHLPLALDALDGVRRFWMFWAARNLMRRLLERGREAVAIRLPAGFETATDEQERTSTRALMGQFERLARETAVSFDARNGNAQFATFLNDGGISRA
jgi:hypothetical protein